MILTKMTLTTLTTSDVRIKGRPDSGPPLVIFLAALLGQPLGDNGFPCSGKLAMSGAISF